VDLAAAAAADNVAMIAQLEAELAVERARVDELMDKSQRMAAEFQNSRRRQEKQLADEIDRAGAHLVKKLLPIVDDFDLAFANVPADLDSGHAWIDGFRQIHKKMHGLLEEEGVVAVPRDGEFDPALHEAVTSEPSENVPSGNIIATLRTGYTYRGRVLRPALVRVAL
jgi:molecular chaperone GrpE